MRRALDQDVVVRLNRALSDRYRIDGEIGSGGMVTVYLAQDLKHDRKVALKVLKPELAAVLGADGFLFCVMPFVEMGKPQYMSPKQASGDREVDGRCDLYSLGCVLNEMLTGEPPHSGPAVQAGIAKLLSDKPRPVKELRDTVPSHVAAVVHKALAKLPADRLGGRGRWQKGVQLAGGSSLPIAEVNQPHGATWSSDGRIVSITQDSRTLLISGPSGTDASRRPIGEGMGQFLSDPRELPDSEWFLATFYSPFVLCAISSETLEIRRLVANGEAGDPNGTPLRGTNPRFVEPGYLVFSAAGDNTLMGARFDPSRLAVLGDPVELVSRVRRESAYGALQLSVSSTGDLVYAPGEDALKSHLVWAQPNGVRDTLPFGPQIYGPYWLTQDASKVAALILSGVGKQELWLLDLERGIPTRWASGGLDEGAILYYGAWLPDSRSVILTLMRADTSEIVRIDAVGASGGSIRWKGRGMVTAQSFDEDGRGLFTVYEAGAGHPADVFLADLPNLPPDVRDAFPPLLDRAGVDAFPSRSPDGEWMIYNSDLEGQWELYAPRVDSDDPQRISRVGADIGRWSPRGDGLYFRNQQSFFRIDLTGNPDRPFSEPEFYLGGDFLNVDGPELSVHPDGRRLLLLEGSPAKTTTRLNFIRNWRQILEERLGGG